MSDQGRGRARGGRTDRGGRGGGRGRADSVERGRGRGGGDGFRREEGERGGNNFRGRQGGGDRGTFRGGRGRPDVYTFRRSPPTQAGGGTQKAIYKDGQNVPAPDAAVTKFENERHLPTGQMAALKLGDHPMPARDTFGTAGRSVVMRTNFFKTELIKKTAVVHHYTVGFGDEGNPSRARTRRYIELLLKQQPFSGVTHYSDLVANIYTVKKVNLGAKDRLAYRVVIYDRLEQPFPAEVSNEATAVNEARVRKTRRLHIEFKSTYDLAELYRYTEGRTGGAYAHKDETTHAMNTIINHASGIHQRIAAQPNNKFYPLNDNLHLELDPHPNYEFTDLGEGLLAIRGYHSSIRLGPSRVLANVNVVTGAFYEPILLHGLVDKFREKNGSNNKLLLGFIKGLKVGTNYMKEKDASGTDQNILKIRTVMSFTKPHPLNANEARFDVTDDDGETTNVSVAEYFRLQYGREVKRPELPVINADTGKNPMLIPMEFCLVIAGQPARRLLSANQTSAMIRFAARPPNANAASIENSGLALMQLTSNVQTQTIRNAGIQMSTAMLTVPARILDPIKLVFKTAQSSVAGGAWNLSNQQFFKNSTLAGKASSLQIQVGRRPPVVQNFAAATREIYQGMEPYGITTASLEPPLGVVQLQSLDRAHFSNIMAKLNATFASAAAKEISWLLISIPEKNPVLYAIVKYLCDVKHGIHTVLVQDMNIAKIIGQNREGRKDPGLAGNVALKFSMKSGGQPWALQPKDLPLIKPKTMVIGLDVTHPSPSSRDGAPSIAAIAWSKDPQLSAWFADGVVQTSRKEMIEGLKDLLVGAIRSWQKHNNNQLPNEILVFRDGVSESQFQLVLDIEFALMLKAFDDIYAKNHPRVSIIVCGKRHHTRFYPTHVKDSDVFNGKGSFNPAPGLVVDRHITGYGENAFDLYLQPHKALQGTAKPCHYIVIKNETGMKSANLEKTIHTMCHGFYRATKAVSLCPPAYCADKAAERFRAYLYQDMNDDMGSVSTASNTSATWTRGVHPNLTETMFYL